jgi:Ca2+-binding EF-hand superfamily protein
MASQFYEKIDDWVSSVLKNPRNLATDVELKEQSKVALNLFTQSDVDGSETLSFDELKLLCEMAGLPMENDEEEALAKMDKDDSGTLDIEEWVKWWLGRISSLPNPIKQQEAIARNTFKKFDADGSGCLDSSELGKLTTALGAEFTQSELKEALEEVDTDGSGLIEISEFLAWWTNRAATNRNNSSLISLKMRKLAMKAAQVFSTDIFTAAWNGDADLVRAFLDGESRLSNASDTTEYGDGWTALHYACFQGHEDVVRLLLEARADVNRSNNLGFSALFYAAQRGHLGICKILMDQGADPSVTGQQALMLPISDGDFDVASGSSGEDVFMCPVEHVLDFPKLRQIFKESSKCSAPLALANPTEDINASVAFSTGLLLFDILVPQKQLSQLPVKQWEVRLKMDMQMDTEMVSAELYADIVSSGLSSSLQVTAKHPKQPQIYSVAVEKVWMKKLHFLCTIHKMKRLCLLEASPEGLRELWSEFTVMYRSIDTQFKSALNVIDFMYLIIKKSPDKTNSKDLRHSLRDALETIVETSHLDQTQSGAFKKPSSRTSKESVDQNAVASKEPGTRSPVQRVEQAITYLCGVWAAAQMAKNEQQAEPLTIQRDRADQKDIGSSSDPSTSKKENTQKQEESEIKAASLLPGEADAKKESGNDGAPKFVLGETKVAPPKVTLNIAGINSWGSGEFSGNVKVSILMSRK